MNFDRLERGLLKSRKTLSEVCSELNIDLPDYEDLAVSQCTQCNVWHWTYKLIEDLDGNPICSYCETIVGM